MKGIQNQGPQVKILDLGGRKEQEEVENYNEVLHDL